MGRSLGDYVATTLTTFRAKVDDPVGGSNHFHVVFNDHDGVAAIDQALKQGEEAGDIGGVQAGGWLVEQV